MHAGKDGINMLSVKKSNRKSILNLMYRRGLISRKDIAQQLGLTPAAITLITTDLLEEGLIVEAPPSAPSNKKGRKEVLLQLNAGRYLAVGVSLSEQQFSVIGTDLANHIFFEETVSTTACQKEAKCILAMVADTISHHLAEQALQTTHKLLGIGVAVTGIVDDKNGVSVNSYHIWEKNVPVTQILRQHFDVPVLLANKICMLAHGETLLAGATPHRDMFFIKYGPGVGATYLPQAASPNIGDYRPIEIAHLIINNYGLPCVCGNEGCLETIVGYHAVERSVAGLITPAESPALYQATGGNGRQVRMPQILDAYTQNDALAVRTMQRVVHALGLAIQNATRLYDPQTIVLYGEPFQNVRFREALQAELSVYAGNKTLTFSQCTSRLETLGPALFAVSHFFESGGIISAGNAIQGPT